MKFDKTRPNIIIVLIDSLRYDFVEKMAFFNRLISEGVYFSKMYSYAPYTRASGHALLSGMYGTRSGMRSWRASWFKGHRIITLQEYLREAGYRTYADLSYILDWPPQGFEIITTYKSHEWADRMAERHSSLLSRAYELGSEESPFFFFLDYLDLHTKHVQLRDGGGVLTPARYHGWVEEADLYLEAIFDHATLLGFNLNTVWIVLSDHGVGGWESEDEPFYGTYLFDYTIRVPCVMWGIGRKEAIDKCVRTVDVMPTILHLLEIEPWEFERLIPMNGKSLLPIIAGKEGKKKRLAYFETHSPEWGPWKSELPNVSGATDGRWKYIRTPSAAYLYDTIMFPQEDENMIGLATRPTKENKVIGTAYRRLRTEERKRRREAREYESRYFGSGHKQEVRGEPSQVPDED